MKLMMKIVDQVVGFFILLAIIALAAAFVFIGINQRWFAKNYYFNTRFLSSNGLNKGMSITLKGFEIGKISDISLNPETKEVDVRFYIYDKYYEHNVYRNSVLILSVSPIGLGNSMIFVPGKVEGGAPPPPLEEESFIFSNQTSEGRDIIKRDVGLLSSGDPVSDILTSIGPLTKQLEPTLQNINETLVQLNDALRGTTTTKIGRMVSDATDIVSNLKKATEGDATQPLGKILVDAGNLTGSLGHTLDDINGEIAKVGSILSNVEGITKDLNKLTSNTDGLIVRLIDPKGSLKTFLDDGNVLYEDVKAMMESVRSIIAELEKVSKFITGLTPQVSGLIEQGKDTLDQGKDVLTAIKNNPLLSGGVPKQTDQATTYQSYRDEEF